MSQQQAAIRRRVEAWLARKDGSTAIALRTRPEWPDDPLLTIDGVPVRIVPCPTPLAARAALHDRNAAERLVLLTDLDADDLGDGILAHLSQQRVRSIDPWDLARQAFGNPELRLDPNLVQTGAWVAEALTEHQPAGGWPTPAGTVLTREHALRCLVGELLGIDRDQIDSSGLLSWSTDAPAVLRFAGLPRAVLDGLSGYLVELTGPAAVPVMAAVRAGHGADAVPLGLLAGALWSDDAPGTEVVIARTRLEPRFGGTHLREEQMRAHREAAEAWIDRALYGDPESVSQAHRLLGRAEAIAAEVGAAGLLAASRMLPSGYVQRLREVAERLRAALPAAGQPEAQAVATVEAAMSRLEQHRAADGGRTGTARMAVRLLRWLATPDPVPETLYEALLRHVRQDGWVDRARLDVFAGDTDPVVADAYAQLHRLVDARRAGHDQRFAELLAAATAAEALPGAMVLVEQVLDRVVQPILDAGRQVLLLVMDGMGVPAATELAESLTTGPWMELTPDGGPRTGVLAALPTITEVSRCSLFSGRIAAGQKAQESKAFQARYPRGELLHKHALRAGAGAALDHDVLAALADPNRPLVAAVVNTIDDALDRSDPGTVVWGVDTIIAVRDLLAATQNRVVVIVSDHGHVVDRGPDARTLPSPSSENRWRPADPPAGDGEVLVAGTRVGMAGGRVVLPWREEVRYGPRKSGYHGGASPAEAVIPLLVLSPGDEHALPGWSGAPVASPGWWREPVSSAEPASAPPPRNGRGRPRTRPSTQDEPLFEIPAASAPPPPAPEPAAGQPPLVAALLASDLYRQRRDPRAPLSDDRVAAMLTALIAGASRATKDTLAAQAGIPAHRIAGALTALRKLLQVEGYPVLVLDPDGQTVHLDAALLAEQFHVDLP